MKVKMSVHFPTAEELVHDVDAVSLIKYILSCYMDNTPLEGTRLHGMMDRMYMYNWTIAGMMMYRRIKTIEQEEINNLKELRSRMRPLKPSREEDKFLYENIMKDLEWEILGLEGTWGARDVVDYSKYEFFLSDYGLNTFSDVIKLEAKKTRRFMTTEELQKYQDDGLLETWLEAPKHEEVKYPKGKNERKAELYIRLHTDPEARNIVHYNDEHGAVGWLSPKGEFLKCGWAEHALKAHDTLEAMGHEYLGDGAFAFDDAEQEFEKMGYIKFWVMINDWGVGGWHDHKPTKAQVKWFEKNIDLLAKRQIVMFENMIKR